MQNFECSIDWLNLIIESTSLVSLFNDLSCLDNTLSFDCFTITDRGTYNYSKTAIHNIAPIRIAWNPSDDDSFSACDPSESQFNPFIFISISGDGLRYLNNHGTLKDILLYFSKFNPRASRLDVALDLYKDDPVVGLLQTAVRNAVNLTMGEPTLKTKLNRTKPDNFLLFEYTDPDLISSDNDGRFYNVTIGNHASSFGMFRMYNKLFEVKYGRLSSFADDVLQHKGIARDGYWWRLEYELHKERANQLFHSLLSSLETSDDCFISAFCSVASTMFTPIDFTQTQLPKCPTNDIWVVFLERISQSINFVELGSLPYINRKNLDVFQKNLMNLSGYIFAAFQWLSSQDTFRDEFLKSGRMKYETYSRYAYIREGIEDLTKGGEAS